MMCLTTPPDPWELNDYYRSCAENGVVFRANIGNKSYGISDLFDPAWGVAAVCWCAGGVERYDFPGGPTYRLKAGTALVIGETERYAYSSSGDKPFESSMIVFPIAMTRSLNHGPLHNPGENTNATPALNTRLFRPSRSLIKRMNSLASAANLTNVMPESVEEQATLVASELIDAQARESRRADRLDSVKRTTREELCRRLGRAITLMHDCYDDSSLDLSTLAREACIARHHFVRVFSAAYGVTPLRYLCELRMEAAARLLESCDASITEIALASGFSDRSAFQRRFRKYFDATPGSWRRQ